MCEPAARHCGNGSSELALRMCTAAPLFLRSETVSSGRLWVYVAAGDARPGECAGDRAPRGLGPCRVGPACAGGRWVGGDGSRKSREPPGVPSPPPGPRERSGRARQLWGRRWGRVLVGRSSGRAAAGEGAFVTITITTRSLTAVCS